VSSTEWSSPDQDAYFKPVQFIEITDYLEKKLAALNCYTEEMRMFPHARSYKTVEVLASLRGSQVGVIAAESFTVLRRILKTTINI
jgi:LmbE family N-acetylglucosaminyl deacetylase